MALYGDAFASVYIDTLTCINIYNLKSAQTFDFDLFIGIHAFLYRLDDGSNELLGLTLANVRFLSQ